MMGITKIIINYAERKNKKRITVNEVGLPSDMFDFAARELLQLGLLSDCVRCEETGIFIIILK